MSRASRQSLTILAIVSGAIITVEEENLSGDKLPAVVYAREVADQTIMAFPETGDPRKNTEWASDRVQALHYDLNNSKKLYTAMCLVSLSQILLTDLMERVRDTCKLAILEPLVEAVNGLADLLDPYGDKFEVYEEADRLAKLVYKEIDFDY